MPKNLLLSENQNIQLIMVASARIDALGNFLLFKPAQISFAGFKLLKLLELHGPLLPSALLLRLGSTKSNITQILHSLEKKQLISRQQGEHDHRQVIISLTVTGSQKIAELTAKMQEAELQLEQHFSPEELIAHQAFFQKLNNLLYVCEQETFKKYE
ncbi:MAG: MarR family transcriptional regulator [Candidatus Falkowbacteria bacterium]